LDFLILIDDLSHHELFETRSIVEPEFTSRAAESATSEDMNALRSAIAAMQNSESIKERLVAEGCRCAKVFSTE
jgi:DNA-binding FadR family transcriptional regulator